MVLGMPARVALMRLQNPLFIELFLQHDEGLHFLVGYCHYVPFILGSFQIREPVVFNSLHFQVICNGIAFGLTSGNKL